MDHVSDLPRPAARRVLAASAVAAVVVLTGCSAGTDAGEALAATTPAPAAPAPATSAPAVSAAPAVPAPPTAAPTPSGPAVQRLSVTVAGGRASGDTGTVPVVLGQPVELTVSSDVADEVHVHGADVTEAVPAGGSVVLRFVQEAPGRFEVELHDSRLLLTRLQVS